MVRTVAFKATSLGSKPYTYVRSRDEVFDFHRSGGKESYPFTKIRDA